MQFKFIGKTKLLRMLKKQMNTPDIWFNDVMYSRKEIHNHYKKETIVFIDENSTQYYIKHEYEKYREKTTLYYEIHKYVSAGNYCIEQQKILKESENS